MAKLNALNYKHLCQKINSKQLKFKTTAELATLTEFIGQERAHEALEFGIDIKSDGFNLFAMGPAGIGKHTIVSSILKKEAAKHPVPSDWCYVHNFEMPEKPISIELPPGVGNMLQQDMKALINELSTSILSVFESDEYRAGMQEIYQDFNQKRKNLGKKTLDKTNHKVPHLYKERHQKEKALQLRFTTTVVEPLIVKLKNKYMHLPQIIAYFTAVYQDIIAHVNDFIKPDETTNILSFALESPILIRYQVNLLIDNSTIKEAPVIFEENPSYSNLICRVEHGTQGGVLLTNFTLIKPGALHKANGGYLVIEARKLKKIPESWEALKRALHTHEIRIEPIESTDTVKAISLEPTPIPLNIKVILIGDRQIYYSFCNHDHEFNNLFKVVADFDEETERNNKNIQLYSRLIATIIKTEKIRDFDASAVAAVIDHSSRLVEDIKKLSTHTQNISDLILEANYWAGKDDSKIVSKKDVMRAIQAQIHRMDRTRESYYEEIKRNFVLIDTTGEKVGQANCLSVVKVGKFSYGHPTRLTAKVRVGKGKIIDIQREIKLAGSMLTKGGLIISNFLASRYNPDQYFSLSASLSFEQIYGVIDGDSASMAELCVLLSALADVPIKQSLAITGSSNQYGEAQAVGGVNLKIEGFFDICREKNLNGKQGVLIPAVNAKNLMLRDDVVEAAKQKKFFIYLINNIDEAITLLTGIPAGKRNKKGQFPVDTINYKVENRLKLFFENYRRLNLKSKKR